MYWKELKDQLQVAAAVPP